MTKLKESTQWPVEFHIYKCWCGEDSYLQVARDDEDKQFYISITVHPTRFLERLRMAWKALRGIEFTASNEVIVDFQDAKELTAALSPQPRTRPKKSPAAKLTKEDSKS